MVEATRRVEEIEDQPKKIPPHNMFCKHATKIYAARTGEDSFPFTIKFDEEEAADEDIILRTEEYLL